MKGTLEFDLNEEDEKKSFTRASKADDAYIVLYKYDEFLRSKIKYGEHTQEVYEAYEKSREELRDLMNSHRISLNDL